MSDTVVNQDAIRAAKITQALQLAAQAQQQQGHSDEPARLPERVYPQGGFQTPVQAPK